MRTESKSHRDPALLDWHEEDGAPTSLASVDKAKSQADGWAENDLQLGEGERLLWLGRPSRAVAVHSSHFVMTMWGVMVCGVSILLILTGVANKELRMVFVGLPVGAVGYFVSLGRLRKDARRRSRARYAVTSKRIVFLWGPRVGRVDSLDLASLSDLSFSERLDRSGTITFGSAAIFAWYDFFASPHRRHLATPRFELDEGVREVFDLICEARHEARDQA